jgi:hypothetical protein
MNLIFEKAKIDCICKQKCDCNYAPYISVTSPTITSLCIFSTSSSLNVKSPNCNLNQNSTVSLFALAMSSNLLNPLVSSSVASTIPSPILSKNLSPVFTGSDSFNLNSSSLIRDVESNGNLLSPEIMDSPSSPGSSFKTSFIPVKLNECSSTSISTLNFSHFPLNKSSLVNSPLFLANSYFPTMKTNPSNKLDPKTSSPFKKRYIPYHMNRNCSKLMIGSNTSNFVPRLSNEEISQMPPDQRKKYYHRLVCDNPECLHDKFVYLFIYFFFYCFEKV